MVFHRAARTGPKTGGRGARGGRAICTECGCGVTPLNTLPLKRENSSGVMSVNWLTPSVQGSPCALCAWILARLASNVGRELGAPLPPSNSARKCSYVYLRASGAAQAPSRSTAAPPPELERGGPEETLGATQGHPSQQARRGTAAQATTGRRVEGAPVLVFGGELAPLELRLRRQSGADGGGCEDEGGRGQHRGGGEVRTKRL